jgi:hypothetical protein
VLSLFVEITSMGCCVRFQKILGCTATGKNDAFHIKLNNIDFFHSCKTTCPDEEFQDAAGCVCTSTNLLPLSNKKCGHEQHSNFYYPL